MQNQKLLIIIIYSLIFQTTQCGKISQYENLELITFKESFSLSQGGFQKKIQFNKAYLTVPQVLIAIYYLDLAEFQSFELSQENTTNKETTIKMTPSYIYANILIIDFQDCKVQVLFYKDIQQQSKITNKYQNTNVSNYVVKYLLPSKQTHQRNTSCFIIGISYSYQQSTKAQHGIVNSRSKLFIETLNSTLDQDSFEINIFIDSIDKSISEVKLNCLEYYEDNGHNKYFITSYKQNESRDSTEQPELYNCQKKSDFCDKQITEIQTDLDNFQLIYGLTGFDNDLYKGKVLVWVQAFQEDYKFRIIYRGYGSYSISGMTSDSIIIKQRDCHQECETCENEDINKCLTCKNKDHFLFKGQCSQEVPQNSFCDQQKNCQECTNKRCLECNNLLSQCISCLQSDDFLYKFECYQQKPLKTYCISRSYSK